mgnify:CR=1 FL=1
MADIVTDLRRKVEQHGGNDVVLHPSYVEDAIAEIEHLRSVVAGMKAANAAAIETLGGPVPDIAWMKENVSKEEMIDFLAGRKTQK